MGLLCNSIIRQGGSSSSAEIQYAFLCKQGIQGRLEKAERWEQCHLIKFDSFSLTGLKISIFGFCVLVMTTEMRP